MPVPPPYLDYRPLRPDEAELLRSLVEQTLATQDIEDRALAYAIAHIVPQHLQEVRQTREVLIDKTLAAVKERLTKEIIYWDHRAEELRLQEAAGRMNARINSERARQRRDELESRLQRRLDELQRARQLAAAPPAVIGGALIVPGGLLARLRGERRSEAALFARETKRVELAAMAAVMAAEQALDHEPQDVHTQNLGYDILSLTPGRDGSDGRTRFIEVKGRIQGAETLTISKNEILTAFNKPDDWILALVEVPPVTDAPADVQAEMLRDEREPYVAVAGCRVRYVRRPFQREPDFDAVSVNYSWAKLWSQGTLPANLERSSVTI